MQKISNLLKTVSVTVAFEIHNDHAKCILYTEN